jgi:DNA polymerase-1
VTAMENSTPETGNSKPETRNLKRVCLVDGNSYVYRAFFATPYLSNSRGVPTNAIYAFLSMIRKLIKEEAPDVLTVVFDSKGPSFREEISREYKARRQPMPENMAAQFPHIKALLAAMGIPAVEKEGFEADDIIATVVEVLKESDTEICIVTSDKDLTQLVSPRVAIYDSMKNLRIGEEEVRAKFGVGPLLVVDYLALAGDPSDNIPGVPGIGEKSARDLVSSFGDLEAIYGNLDRITKPALREKLKAGREYADLSKKLATLRPDVPFENLGEFLKMGEEDRESLRKLLRELEFTSLYREMAAEDSPGKAVRECDFSALDRKAVALSVYFRGKNSYDMEMEHFAAFDGTGACFSTSCDDLLSLLSGAEAIVTHNVKPLFVLARKRGATVNAACFDTMLASYLVNPLRKEHALEGIIDEYCHVLVEQGTARQACMEKASHLFELRDLLLARMKDLTVLELFSAVEAPLVEVLAGMEFTGVRIDRGMLGVLSRDFDQRLTAIAKDIYGFSGGPFNINSPQQLSNVLFNVLKLPPVKKTKTGFSTDTEVLQTLSAVHGLPARILEYRTLAKLKSTYVDTLPSLINPFTGRIHTTFNQTVVSTGRLSSSDPNLQNIPIRGEEGRKIREAFVAEEGYLLLSSDYSQIELRVLAHLSGDPVLLDTFLRDDDIHTRVAQEVFGVAPGDVTHEMRRTAKVINFGIIYGMSSFGLARELNVSQKEAQTYIDDYFTKHRGVKAFMEGILEDARRTGYVRTLLGRVRNIPELNNPDNSVRQFGERIAMNTPIQGTAADLIKLAMVNIAGRFREKNLSSKLIMQIHDELVFEVKAEELEIMEELVRKEMEGVMALSVPLKVSIGCGKNWALAHD